MTTNILGTVTNERKPEGVRMVIAANEKMGKTTLAAGAPRALLVPLEIGYGGVNVNHTAMLQDYASVDGLLDEILTQAYYGQFPFQTIVFDSATALERFIHAAVLMKDGSYLKGNKKAVTMESALGGYGKAYTYANELFGNFLAKCDQLAVWYGINIVLTCHVFAAQITDPTNGVYDSWDLQLHSPKNQKTFGKREMVTQWADVVGFIHEEIHISKTDDMSKGVAANTGRLLGLSRTPSYVAGNRFGVEGAIALPKENGWNFMAQAIFESSGVNIFNYDVIQ